MGVFISSGDVTPMATPGLNYEAYCHQARELGARIGAALMEADPDGFGTAVSVLEEERSALWHTYPKYRRQELNARPNTKLSSHPQPNAEMAQY